MQRQKFAGLIRFSCVLSLSLLVVMFVGLLKPEAAVQPVSFGAKTDFGTGTSPFSVAVGDFNGDGKLDLAVANDGSATVSILLGTGNGSFGAKTDFGTGSVPRSVAVGDFNGDGQLDLAVANANSATISILLGTGTGSFGAKTDFGTGNGPQSVAVGDFNGDGKLDLAVANSASGTISILLGTGTGSFGAKTDFGTGSSPFSVAVGDFNGDGKLDLVANNNITVSILLGTGTGSFGAKTDFGTGSGPISVAVGDFNGDGQLDLAVANAGSPTVSILLGTGTGTFGAKTDFGTGSAPRSVAVGDFNGDGKLDLAVTNGNSATVSILLGMGTGGFGAKTDFGTGINPFSVAVGDFNGDGQLDLAVANFNSNTVSILLNTTPIVASGVFCSKTDFGTGSIPVSVAMGDFNGDGKLDLAVANASGNTVSILLGTGTGSFGTKTDFGTGSTPFSVAVGDFNGDGKLDLAVANSHAPTVSILLGTGTGSFGAKTDFGTGADSRSVAVGDFNGDGKLDLAVANLNDNTVSILLGTGTGSFGAKTDFGTGSSPISVAVGDFNGNGKLDLAVANLNDNTVSILLGTGTGSFGAKTDFGTGSHPISVAVRDFNGDGKLDLAVANSSSNTVSILLGTGTGSFGAKTDFGTGNSPFSVAVGDFNGDGKLDLAVANVNGNTVSILLGTGTGSFGAKTTFGMGSFPLSVAVGDFNGDGKLDLAVANQGSSTVSILLNNTPPSITAAPVTRTAGNPSANSQIATVNDAQETSNTLTVTVNGGTSATVNGVTVTLNPTAPNASGQVFADVVAACGATTADFTLLVTDGCGLFTEAMLTVTVTANPAPVLTYSSPQSVTLNGSLMLSPANGPSDNVSVSTIAVQSAGTYTGTISVNNSTGVVAISSAAPVGTHSITIRATDNCGVVTDASFTLNVNKGNQAITVNGHAPANATFNSQFTVAATSDSGLPVSYGSAGACTNSGATFTMTSGTGTCTVKYDQLGDGNYNKASQVTESVTAQKASQTITFAAVANKTFGDPDFSVSPTASSNLAVGLGATGNCTVTSPAPGTVHITAAGSCTITASQQAGNNDYGAATDVPRSFNISKAFANPSVTSSVNPADLNQSITFTATLTGPSGTGTPTGTVQFKDGGTNLGAPVTLNASGAAQFTTSTLTTGNHNITADYSGDTNFLTVTGTLAGGQVVKFQPTLSINDVSIAEGHSGASILNFTVTLSAASSLTVTANYATADGTATAPSDYTAIASTLLTFNPGDTSKTVAVTINGDISFEPDETFTVNLTNPTNTTITKAAGNGTIQNDDAQGGFFSFSPATYNVSEATGVVTVTVIRTNDVTQAANVDYATDDTGASTNCAALNTGLAAQRCDYTSVFGTLKFAANETQKTIDIPINLDAYIEGPENFTVKLSNPTGGAALIAPSSALVTINDSASPTPNAIDDTADFVRQQYHDFLNRDADPSGLAFWKNNIDKCNDPAQRPPGQTVAQCIEVQRILTSAAFFLSIEFRQTGGLVRDFYVASLFRPLTNNMPDYVELMRDTQAIQRGVVVNQGNWQQTLDTNRQAFMNEFVTRAEFVALYPTTDTPTQYVDRLYQHANVTGTQQERLDAIAYFGGALTAADTGARARALLRVTQSGDFQAREANRTFVQIEYFGYLRRNPNDAPDHNFDGYNFWVNKLIQVNGDFLQAEMVKAFLRSSEYRARFGP